MPDQAFSFGGMEKMAEADGYTLTEEDERELKSIREQLDQLDRRITQLTPPDAHLEGLKASFPLGTGGNHRSGGTQFQKHFDLSIERAAKASPLYLERIHLLEQEHALLTGARAKERERETARQRKQEDKAARVRQARCGEYVVDRTYGTVRVVRVNTQSLTIETESGRKERRAFSAIERVAFTEAEIIGWFVKRDEAGQFPIREFVHEALESDTPIEAIATWLKDETHQRYPDFISNLPWQQIARHFHDEGQVLMKPEKDSRSAKREEPS
jgi:hypothetical protein